VTSAGPRHCVDRSFLCCCRHQYQTPCTGPVMTSSGQHIGPSAVQIKRQTTNFTAATSIISTSADECWPAHGWYVLTIGVLLADMSPHDRIGWLPVVISGHENVFTNSLSDCQEASEVSCKCKKNMAWRELLCIGSALCLTTLTQQEQCRWVAVT